MPATRSGERYVNDSSPPAADDAPADRGQLIDHTFQRLRRDILGHKLRPGVKLTAEHVASLLSVSRTPVRQALERLCQEGYVTRIPARGYFVAEISTPEARNLYDVRQVLELYTLEAAFRRGFSKADLVRLLALHEQYGRSIGSDQVIARSEVDQQFHLTIAELSGNDVALKTLRDIFDRLNFRRRCDGYWLWTAGSARGYEGLAEHQRLVEAILTGDRDGALRHLCTHLDRARENYEHFLGTVNG